MTGSLRKVLVIVGPTASGKSAVAEAIADVVDAEIVSADSMQIYRGMDVATDKPDAQRRARYRYHMLDVADPAEPFTVVRFRRRARQAIARISSAGRLPIVAGGSGLYVRAVIDDLEFPPASRDLSQQERDELESSTSEELFARLSRLDPRAAVQIHPNNRRRLIRALEFIAETDQPFSNMQERWSRYCSIYDARIFGLDVSRSSLNATINRRVDHMVARGLLGEARHVLKKKRTAATARQAIGYKELEAYFSGTEELGQAVERLKASTRRFAKRQLTWFRADKRVEWVDAGTDAADVAARIVETLRDDAWLDGKRARPLSGR